MFKIRKEGILQFIKILFPLFLFVFAAIEMKKVASGINTELLRSEVGQLHIWKTSLLFMVAICAVMPMLLYDVVLVKILKIKMKTEKLVKQSFIVNTFSNLIGFGGLVGLMLRSYFYKKHSENEQALLKTIASVTLFSLTGISLFTWSLPIGFRTFPLLTETKWLLFAVWTVSLLLPLFILFYVFQSKRINNSIIGWRIGTKLVLVSVLEWLAIFFVIWFLTILLEIPIHIFDLIPVFIVASCAGIVSMIPGGIGSFDLVFLWGTQSLGISDEKVLILLILYRIGYFFLPFLLAFVLFIKEYWDQLNRSWSNIPNVLFQRFSHTLLTILVFASGIILLLSAAVPGVFDRLKIAQKFLSLPIMNVSHQLTVAAGFILLGLWRGIEYKVKRAYQFTIVVLSCAALFSVFKGFDYEETIFLIIVALLLKAAKKQFYRESYVSTWGKFIFDVAVIVVITAMYVLIGYLNLPASRWAVPITLRPYVITDYNDLFYSALMGLAIGVCILFVGYRIFKTKRMEMESSIGQEDKIRAHLHSYKGTALTHLIFLHDKYVFWNKKNTVLFSYQTYADKLVVLGDPVGEKADFGAAIEEFLEKTDLFGYTLIFYEVRSQTHSTLHEYGYDFLKLGEEALVDLSAFTLSGKRRKGERAAKNKFEREQFQFELLHPPFQSDLMAELKTVSDQWLKGRKEQCFSLGYFDESYLNKAGIAFVRNEKGILAFASLMPTYDENQMISVDLMRFKQGAPSGTMDFMFLSLFEWAKKEGYQSFNLGMAPLSNVGLSKFSFLSERISAQIYLHGKAFYHFKGLKSFKDKYTDVWEPKYLAYRKKYSLPFTMAQVTLLIRNKRN
ncbi:bifunctional lysylphosphatidylglycerol flippase/synthetase MprF [bacterium LRH843]|nr:bifunctional lysylphosphatidylglycerol flippase/synthetase MprF [bacterium LRH843]